MLQANVSNALIRRSAIGRRPLSVMERGQRILLLALAALTVVAWLLTLAHTASTAALLGAVMPGGAGRHGHGLGLQEAARLAGHGMVGTGWSVSGFLAFAVAWAVMMAAMMFPGLAPMLLTVHAIAHHRRGPRGGMLRTASFVAGYLLVWTAVGGLIWAVVQLLGHGSSWLHLAGPIDGAPLLLGSTLIVAGLYQFTPFKRVCLDHCRSPFIEVMQRWREGHGGALRMGIGHGLYCLGCCWALFTVLVAAGVMSLAWMLALTLIDFSEKALPFGRRAGQGVGVAFLVLGVAVAARMIVLP